MQTNKTSLCVCTDRILRCWNACTSSGSLGVVKVLLAFTPRTTTSTLRDHLPLTTAFLVSLSAKWKQAENEISFSARNRNENENCYVFSAENENETQ